MNFPRTRAVARKEFIQIYRDRRSLTMAVAIPILLLVLFGYALTMDVNDVPLVVWDQEKNNLSRDFLMDFQAPPYFNITGYCENYSCIENLINKNQALMALVMPRNFSALLKAGKPSPVQLIVDGSDSNTATIAIGYVQGVVWGYNQKLWAKTFSAKNFPSAQPVDLRPRVWFNPDLKSRNFIVPGLIAVIMTIIAALLTSLTVSREWERGTMEQLISTPVKPAELVLGKLMPYFVIGMFDLAVAVSMGVFLFHVPLRGSLLLLVVLSGLFLSGALSLGILISILAKNQLLASQMSMITTFLPSFILSGFMYAISNMPQAVQVVTHIIPARYYIIILKGIYLKGVGLKVLWPEAVFLAAFSFVMVNVAVRKFRKQV